MPKQKTLEQTFKECEVGGMFKDQELVDKDKINSILQIAQTNINVAEQVRKPLDNKSLEWSVVYKLYYDAIMGLADALVRFDNKKIPNHQCLFAYLCFKFSELDLSWDFFEQIRTKRNGLNYYGTPINHDDWKQAEIQFKLYIKIIKEELNKKLK